MIEEIIEKIIEGRIDVSGSADIYVEILDEDGEYVDELSIGDEIEQALQEKGIEYSVEMWEVFDNPGITIYALSVAWIENEELSQYCTTLESF
jgi:hypothetical protein